MTKLLSIVGPTAVGKSSFAQTWAEHYCQSMTAHSYQGVCLISADSRQVYQGLEIVSGIDLGPEWRANGLAWQHTSLPISLHGVSFLAPTGEWSVAHFQSLSHAVIDEAIEKNYLPVIVGGTGLYVSQVATTDPKLHIPPNQEVREKAESLTLAELQAWLAKLNPERLETMNHADQQNPRRLVRAIEIHLGADNATPMPMAENQQPELDQCLVGLSQPFEVIEAKIADRVKARLAAGAVSEIEKILANFPDQHLPLYSATGVRPILAYLQGQATIEEVEETWTRQERQYAKRQLTWWKKHPEVKWFTVTEPGKMDESYDLIASWLAS